MKPHVFPTYPQYLQNLPPFALAEQCLAMTLLPPIASNAPPQEPAALPASSSRDALPLPPPLYKPFTPSLPSSILALGELPDAHVQPKNHSQFFFRELHLHYLGLDSKGSKGICHICNISSSFHTCSILSAKLK